jgi:hypothetical protein
MLRGRDMSIDYDKFKKVFGDEFDRQKIDTMINVSGLEVISKYDEEMMRSKFSAYENNRMKDLMTDRERELFVVVRSIANKEINFLLNAISKLLVKD